MLSALRRLRLAVWAAGLRLRLRRVGMRADVRIGRNVRFVSLPRLDVEPVEGPGGTLRLTIGDDARLGRDTVLGVRRGGRNTIEIGPGAVFGDHVRLQARGGAIRLGEHVHLRDFCECKSDGELTVGARVLCARGATLHCTERVSLGDEVGIAERVTITDSDHGHDGSARWFMAEPLVVEPVTVEANVLVATNAVVLRGSVLRRNSVVAAGAVVAGLEVPEAHLAGGVPARVLKAL
jgi:acetyltransferase-like isoleucine patch superfamily enzyme